jgi:hypothetical protein
MEDEMANYYTHFSCAFDVGSIENVEKAMAIFNGMKAAVEKGDEGDPQFADASCNFECEPMGGVHGALETEQTLLWIHDEESGSPGDVLEFVERCRKELKLKGSWGFCWSDDCSKPRMDAFGGGAAVVNLRTGRLRTMSTHQWLEKHVR